MLLFVGFVSVLGCLLWFGYLFVLLLFIWDVVVVFVYLCIGIVLDEICGFFVWVYVWVVCVVIVVVVCRCCCGRFRCSLDVVGGFNIGKVNVFEFVVVVCGD